MAWRRTALLYVLVHRVHYIAPSFVQEGFGRRRTRLEYENGRTIVSSIVHDFLDFKSPLNTFEVTLGYHYAENEKRLYSMLISSISLRDGYLIWILYVKEYRSLTPFESRKYLNTHHAYLLCSQCTFHIKQFETSFASQ